MNRNSSTSWFKLILNGEQREREGEMKRVQSGGDTFVDTMLKH